MQEQQQTAFIVVCAIVYIGFAAYIGKMAKDRGYNPVMAFFLAVLTSPILAYVIVFIMATGKRRG